MNSSATEADQREFLLIEAFRGFAAFLVVYTHFWALSPGSPSLLRFAHTGVDLFFVLSGYVFGPYFFGNEFESFCAVGSNVFCIKGIKLIIRQN